MKLFMYAQILHKQIMKSFCERNGILVILQTSSLPCVGDKSTEKEKCPREILPSSDSHLSSIKLQHF